MHRKLIALMAVTLAGWSGAAPAQDAEATRADAPRGRGGFYQGTDPAELSALRSGIPLTRTAEPAPASGYYRESSWYRDTDSQRRRYEPRYHDDDDDVRVIHVRRYPRYRWSFYGTWPYYSHYPRDPHYYYHHFNDGYFGSYIGLGFHGSFRW